MSQQTLEERFWSEVVEGDPDECWPWMGKTCGAGYGRIWTGRKDIRVHRIAYQERVGPIPEGLVIDHLCHNRICVNPAHLEAVTDRENVLRGEAPPAENARKTHCIHGHPFTPENTVLTAGARQCRICNRARDTKARPNRPPRYGPDGNPCAECGTKGTLVRSLCSRCYDRRRKRDRSAGAK